MGEVIKAMHAPLIARTDKEYKMIIRNVPPPLGYVSGS